MIGRWLAVDPMEAILLSYVLVGNDPVSRVDLDGGTDGPGDGLFRFARAS